METNMETQFSRTEILIGKEAVRRLSASRVAVFGVGGVGGYVCEALVRSGVGAFDLIDSDRVALSNLNRQIVALHSTIGQYKVDVMRERMLAINPQVKVNVHKCFFLPENAQQFPFSEYDYVVDAVDTVTAKIALVMKCREAGVPIISSMGAGNKLDASLFQVADLFQTKVCPLAKVMRRECKKRGIKNLKVVYSEEMPLTPGISEAEEQTALHADKQSPDTAAEGSRRRSVPGSVAFVPSVAGLILAGEVVKDLYQE